MGNTVISSEFLGSNRQEQLAMCSKLAAEAELRASQAINPETRRAYLDLKQQWDELATQLKNGPEAPLAIPLTAA